MEVSVLWRCPSLYHVRLKEMSIEIRFLTDFTLASINQSVPKTTVRFIERGRCRDHNEYESTYKL